MTISVNVPKVLAVIPARGGSKRLPRKNILPLCGKPLIGYTIDACKAATVVTDWLVSTDDEEIAEIAKECGAPVPFLRPKSLGGDMIRNSDVLCHALNYMERTRGYLFDYIILLQPTSPIRNPAHIDQAVDLLISSDLPTVASVKGPYKKRDPILKRIDNEGVLKGYCDGVHNVKDDEPFYIYNASIYGMTRDHLLSTETFVSKRQAPLLMDEVHSVDIDTNLDFAIAEACLKNMQEQIYE